MVSVVGPRVWCREIGKGSKQRIRGRVSVHVDEITNQWVDHGVEHRASDRAELDVDGVIRHPPPVRETCQISCKNPKPTIAGPIAGTANPNVLPWTPTGFSATDVRILVTARDSRGAEGTSVSEAFEVDSTPPTIAARLPAPNAGNVPVNANVHVTWSEGMSQAASGAADAFAVQRVSDGAWISGSITWSPDATQMTCSPECSSIRRPPIASS